ncbi:hypothetical protein SDC9_168572 [bioreactor metagenome]|uniref:Uncharacterized protein n=1 Tax=bioreactor metagenome TaxID=1076179 RepID=A0A645GBD3_9ZZZZ
MQRVQNRTDGLFDVLIGQGSVLHAQRKGVCHALLALGNAFAPENIEKPNVLDQRLGRRAQYRILHARSLDRFVDDHGQIPFDDRETRQRLIALLFKQMPEELRRFDLCHKGARSNLKRTRHGGMDLAEFSYDLVPDPYFRLAPRMEICSAARTE